MYIDVGRAQRELQELADFLVETSNLDAGSSFFLWGGRDLAFRNSRFRVVTVLTLENFVGRGFSRIASQDFRSYCFTHATGFACFLHSRNRQNRTPKWTSSKLLWTWVHF